jgi:hypothetical protein
VEAASQIRPTAKWPLVAGLLTFLFAAVPLRAQLPLGPQPPASGRTEPSPQLPPSRAESGAPQSAIAVETALVNLDVLVTDEDGRVLGGLKRGNFRLTDNGREQSLTNFASVSAPITIVMLTEYSGMAYDYFAYKAASWGSDFLNHLEPEDFVALVTYDMKSTVRVDFTRNKAQVRDALSLLSYPTCPGCLLAATFMHPAKRARRVPQMSGLICGVPNARCESVGIFAFTWRPCRPPTLPS